MTDGNTLAPAWFALLIIALPMGLAGLAFLFGHALNPRNPGTRYRQTMWDRTGWFLLGSSAMAGGLVWWWMTT